jgi:hypothetical protein
MPKNFKYGARPRTFDPRFPHYSALFHRKVSVSPPASFNYADDLPTDLGMMGNDRYGDCAWAAVYHAIQLWSKFSRGVEITEPDNLILQAYSECTGFDPNNPNTDQGTVLQQGLQYMMIKGLPINPSPAPRDRHHILTPLEVDPRNLEDIKNAIWECGCVYIGFTVPASLDIDLNSGNVPMSWDWTSGDSLTNDGHCIILTGTQSDGSFNLVSWGLKEYSITPSFVQNCVTEVYAIPDPTWMQATGKTPLGLTVAELQDLGKPLQTA